MYIQDQVLRHANIHKQDRGTKAARGTRKTREGRCQGNKEKGRMLLLKGCRGGDGEVKTELGNMEVSGDNDQSMQNIPYTVLGTHSHSVIPCLLPTLPQSLIREISTECLLSFRHTLRHWRFSDELDTRGLYCNHICLPEGFPSNPGGSAQGTRTHQ